MVLKRSGYITVMLSCLLVAPSFAGDLQDLKNMVDKQNYEKAYQHGKSIQFEYEGDPHFDFYFGLAAIEMGHYNEAVFALERVALNYPENNRGRLEYAKALYLSKSYEAARTEFELVKQSNPPESVRNNIDLFLADIEKALRGQRYFFKSYVATRLGTDSNVNSATDNKTFEAFGVTFNISDDGNSQADGVYDLLAGTKVTYKIDDNWAWFAGLDVKRHGHFAEKQYDTDEMKVNYGINYQGEKYSVRVPIDFSRTYLDHNNYKKTLGASLQYTQRLTAVSQLSANVSASSNRYQDAELQNTNSYMGGLSYAYAYTPKPYLLTLSAVYLNDDPKLVDYNGKESWIASMMVQRMLKKNQLIFASAYASEAKYQDIHPTFLDERRDNIMGMQAGWLWNRTKNLSFNADVGYTINSSNISVYDIKRFTAGTGVRYDF